MCCGGGSSSSSVSGACQAGVGRWVGGVHPPTPAFLGHPVSVLLINQTYAAKWAKFEKDTKRPRSSPLFGLAKELEKMVMNTMPWPVAAVTLRTRRPPTSSTAFFFSFFLGLNCKYLRLRYTFYLSELKTGSLGVFRRDEKSLVY